MGFEDVNAHVRLLGVVGVQDELKEPGAAKDAGDARLVKELADITASGGTQLSLGGAVSFLGLSNEGAKGAITADTNEGHYGSNNANGSHSEDEVVYELGTLT
jgi:hypothetical protein